VTGSGLMAAAAEARNLPKVPGVLGKAISGLLHILSQPHATSQPNMLCYLPLCFQDPEKKD
jgi:hypothetical protein